MILQNGLYTGQRSVSGPFTQSVQCGMKAFHPTKYRCQYITYSQIIIIVRMEIEVQFRITFPHLPHIFDDLQRVQDTECIRQHETLDTTLPQSVNQAEHIFRRILDTVTPVFQIDIYIHSPTMGITDNFQDIAYMRIERLFS